MYEIIFSDKAKIQLKKLSKDTQNRIVIILERIKIRPGAYIKKLVGIPYYGLRAGDYRIILDIIKDKLVIFVIEIGHRKNIYKKL